MIHRICLLTTLLVILFLLPRLAGAVTVDNLYQAKVDVTSESDLELQRGARQGFQQVLVKVSGTMTVISSELVRDALGNPADYYYQYSFENTDRVRQVNGAEVPVKQLVIVFDPSSVARLLREAGMPVWGSKRPGVLVWLAISRDGERFLAKGDENLVLVNTLKERARQRGVPLLFPLMDLIDSFNISAAEVWGGFLDRVEGASSRYNPDLVLTGRVHQLAGGLWSGNWRLQIDDGWLSIQGTDMSEMKLVQGLVDQLVDELASRFALDSSRGQVQLSIEGVKSLANFVQVADYLAALTPVTRSNLKSLQGESVTYELETEGHQESLINIIGLSGRMLLLEKDEQGANLKYRWLETEQEATGDAP